MRSAASWMGVSGFLISWARRRATSPQAASRWASMSRVRSSNTSTRPGGTSPVEGSMAQLTMKMRRPPATLQHHLLAPFLVLGVQMAAAGGHELAQQVSSLARPTSERPR